MPTYPVIDPPVTEGDHFFTLEEAAALEYGASSPSEELLANTRDVVEQLLERETGRAFVPRIDTLTIRGPVRWPVRLRRTMIREITDVSINDNTLSASQLSDVVLDGHWVGVALNHYWTGYEYTGQPNAVTITYTHGYDETPKRIKQAALLLLRTWIVEKPVDSRATQLATQEGRINLATPGLRGSITGIPEVDEAIAEFSRGNYIT